MNIRKCPSTWSDDFIKLNFPVLQAKPLKAFIPGFVAEDDLSEKLDRFALDTDEGDVSTSEYFTAVNLQAVFLDDFDEICLLK